MIPDVPAEPEGLAEAGPVEAAGLARVELQEAAQRREEPVFLQPVFRQVYPLLGPANLSIVRL